MERGTGIEPAALAWKARVLPLYEPRNRGQLKKLTPGNQSQMAPITSNQLFNHWWRGKDSNLRTLRERIYSPSPLTTRPPLQTEPKIMQIFLDAVNPNIDY